LSAAIAVIYSRSTWTDNTRSRSSSHFLTRRDDQQVQKLFRTDLGEVKGSTAACGKGLSSSSKIVRKVFSGEVEKVQAYQLQEIDSRNIFSFQTYKSAATVCPLTCL
jgi:hypothetical protein